MSNIIVEGFASYGFGGSSFFEPQQAVIDAMTSGIWAEMASYTSIVTLPWDSANLETYLGAQFLGAPAAGQARRVLPQALAVSRYSFYYAVSALPGGTEGQIIRFADNDNTTFMSVRCTSTGALAIYNGNNQLIGVTAGPVIPAQTAIHLEMEVNTDAKSIKIYAQDALVLDLEGGSVLNQNHIAQFAILIQDLSSSGSPAQYISHIIVRDNNGTQNNTFPMGDRKVATLFVNSDDVAHQGWSGHPIHRFGNGVLDMTKIDNNLTEYECAVSTNDNAHTDLGNGDFTLEGQFRFQRLPTGATKMVLWGKWDETNNLRSYQFYLGGPNLENGLLVFRTSTDGTNGTVVEKLEWAWAPDPCTWYEICLERVGGELVLYIDGVQQGLPIEDTDTYFVGNELWMLGAQAFSGGVLVGQTNFRGWIDEFRFTKGLGRYSANYAPHTAAFPRHADDPQWGAVALLCSFDLGVIADDGPLGLPLVGYNTVSAITPDDGAFYFQLMDKNKYPFDDSFIQAALVPATDLLTFVGQPAVNDTVTVGTKDGAAAAVYTFVAAAANPFEVTIGADLPTSMNNLISAIIAGAGSGSAYGAGTTANANVTASLEPTNQVLATALVAGVIGNTISATEASVNGSWATATLLGGLDIPPYSQYGMQRLPSNTSLVDSITISSRQWKTDAGVASSQMSLVGPNAGVLAGDTNPMSTTPTTFFDTFEVDPDNPDAALSPTAVLLSKIRVNRVT